MRAIELYEKVEWGADSAHLMPDGALDEFVSSIKTKCSKFLGERGDGWLFRRDGDFDHSYGEATPREDRTPLSTPKYVHQAAIKGMIDRGAKAHRGNSFFAYNNSYDTTGFDSLYGGEFGAIYVILPHNGYHYTWVEKVHDFTIQGIIGDVDDNSVANWFAEHKMHVDQHMSAALDEKNEIEIMIQGRVTFVLSGLFENIIKDRL